MDVTILLDQHCIENKHIYNDACLGQFSLIVLWETASGMNRKIQMNVVILQIITAEILIIMLRLQFTKNLYFEFWVLHDIA